MGLISFFCKRKPEREPERKQPGETKIHWKSDDHNNGYLRQALSYGGTMGYL